MSFSRASLKAFLNREHTFDVSADRLTRILGRAGAHNQTVAENIEDLALAVAPEALTAFGRFRQNGLSGRFHLRLRPVEVIWEAGHHALVFQILDHDIRFDRSIKGLLAAIGMAAVSGLFGKNYILGKKATVIDGDRVRFELDQLNPLLQPLLEAVTLTRIECVENALRLCFQAHPRRVLRSCGRCLHHWWTQPAGQQPPNSDRP